MLGLAMLALAVTLAHAGWLFAQHAALALDYPYNLNYGEGPLLDQAARLARGEGIYSLSAPPYLIANYPPVYPLVVAPFIASYGPSFL